LSGVHPGRAHINRIAVGAKGGMNEGKANLGVNSTLVVNGTLVV
jgi:hypothetical protein